MVNVTQGDFVVTKKYIDDNSNVLMFDWYVEFNVEGAITPLQAAGTELVPEDSNLTVNSTNDEYKSFLESTKIATFFDDLLNFQKEQAVFHLIRETATEVE
jgi:hypothetical protein